MNPIETLQEILISELQTFTNWDERYGHIIALGKQLPPMPQAFKTEANQVKGCQSTVWMHAESNPEGVITFYADSDALIVKGLIALLVRIYSGQPAELIVNTPPFFLERLELANHLSMQRSNGLAAVLKQMKLYAQVFLLQQA